MMAESGWCRCEDCEWEADVSEIGGVEAFCDLIECPSCGKLFTLSLWRTRPQQPLDSATLWAQLSGLARGLQGGHDRRAAAERRSSWDVEAWARAAAERYPAIESIHLVGSRATGQVHEVSDWDLLVCLSRAAYDEEGEPADDTERRLTFDPDLSFEGLDLFFLRPDGREVRWTPEAEPETVHFVKWMWWQGDWRKGEREHARCLYGKSLVEPPIRLSDDDQPVALVMALRRHEL